MFGSTDLVRLTMAERQREAEHGRLAAFARCVATCCAPATLRSRIAALFRGGRDDRCPSNPQLARRAPTFTAG